MLFDRNHPLLSKIASNDGHEESSPYFDGWKAYDSNPYHPLLSKIASNDGHGESSAYFDGWKAYDRNPYHPDENGNGVIQMGLAENQLCLDLMQEWIKKHPEASICTGKGVSEFNAIANFQDYHGLPKFRQVINISAITGSSTAHHYPLGVKIDSSSSHLRHELSNGLQVSTNHIVSHAALQPQSMQ